MVAAVPSNSSRGCVSSRDFITDPDLGSLKCFSDSRWHHGNWASIECMTSKLQNRYPEPGPNNGFVVAMRAKLIGSVRRLPYEWMIVSRWGAHGEYLSIGWTGLPALRGDAP